MLGDLDGLRARADSGDQRAARHLAGLLAERGDLDELGAWVVAGTENAARHLTEQLIERGRADEAEQLRRFGLDPDGSIACT